MSGLKMGKIVPLPPSKRDLVKETILSMQIKERDITIAALRARIRTLEGALKPFTTSRFGSALPDDKTAPSVCFLNVTVGDLRRAKAALDGGADADN